MGFEERLKSLIDDLKLQRLKADPKASYVETPVGRLDATIEVLEGVYGLYMEDQGLHPCDRCDKVFDNPNSLKMHRLAAHKVSPKG